MSEGISRLSDRLRVALVDAERAMFRHPDHGWSIEDGKLDELMEALRIHFWPAGLARVSRVRPCESGCPGQPAIDRPCRCGGLATELPGTDEK